MEEMILAGILLNLVMTTVFGYLTYSEVKKLSKKDEKIT